VTDAEKETLLNQCIDDCAGFEKQTGMKTSEIHAFSQKDLALKTGLTLKNIKKWLHSAKTALELIAK